MQAGAAARRRATAGHREARRDSSGPRWRRRGSAATSTWSAASSARAGSPRGRSSATTSVRTAGHGWRRCRSASTTRPPSRIAGGCTCTAAIAAAGTSRARRRCCCDTRLRATAGAGFAPLPRRAPRMRRRWSAAASTLRAGPTSRARCARSRSTTSARKRWLGGPRFPGPARNHTTGVASGGRFYVLAGRDSANFRAAERYDPRTSRWQRLPPHGNGARRDRVGAVARRPHRRLRRRGAGRRRRDHRAGRAVRPAHAALAARCPTCARPGTGSAASSLGNRVYALQGGPRPGFHFSDAVEFLDVR